MRIGRNTDEEPLVHVSAASGGGAVIGARSSASRSSGSKFVYQVALQPLDDPAGLRILSARGNNQGGSTLESLITVSRAVGFACAIRRESQ